MNNSRPISLITQSKWRSCLKDTNYKTDSHTQKSPSSISKIEFLTTSLRKNILKPDGFAGTVYQLLQGERRRGLRTLAEKGNEGGLPNFFTATKTRQTLRKNHRHICLVGLDINISTKNVPKSNPATDEQRVAHRDAGVARLGAQDVLPSGGPVCVIHRINGLENKAVGPP